MAIQRILVPVDYSACSRAALDIALELSERFRASVEVVHVWDRPSYVPDPATGNKQPISGKLIQLIEQNAERELSEFLQSSGAGSAKPPPGRLLSGDPASAILRAIAGGEYDLVVVGTHGRTGLAHALLGSVAEKIVRLSTAPVLTVPDSAAQRLRR